jgi:hypothetical protein
LVGLVEHVRLGLEPVRHGPLLLVDVDAHPDAVGGVARLKRSFSNAGVVAVSRSVGADLWDIAEAGADGYLVKSDSGPSMTVAVGQLIQEGIAALETDNPSSCRIRFDASIAGC